MVKVNGIKNCTDSTQSKLNIRMPCVTSLKVSAKIPHDFDRKRHMSVHVHVSTFHKEYLTLLPGHFFLIIIFISSWYPFNSFIVKLKDKCRTCPPYPIIYSINNTSWHCLSAIWHERHEWLPWDRFMTPRMTLGYRKKMLQQLPRQSSRGCLSNNSVQKL